MIVRCQTKVHNYKCSYLCCNIILLFSEILLLIEFCFIRSRVFLIFSHCPKYMPDIIFLTEILFERRSNIACLCYFRSPSYGGPYDGRRYLIPHCMGEEHFSIVDSRLRDITSAEHLRNFFHTFVHIEERHRARCALSSLLLQHFIMVTAN